MKKRLNQLAEMAEEASLTLPAARPALVKKKRNLPGTPDPEAEVIALSPATLMATNRFLCEICGKGFQRDQNLQLHRRGHNLPWKLRQRSGKETTKKRVYVCPNKSCVHHNHSRALGDLTGIKKHFSRKHGEKKWKCDKCSKRYAVQSDWKAHAKVCGAREYRCDCGILFSRRDSFITHRAFCDALAEEAARISAASIPSNPLSMGNAVPSLARPPENLQPGISPMAFQGFSPSGAAEQLQWQLSLIYNNDTRVLGAAANSIREEPLNISPLASMPFLLNAVQPENQRPPDMSATALLQKAAQLGVVSSSIPSLLAGFDLKYSGLPGYMPAANQLPHYNVVGHRNESGAGRVGGGEITRDFLGVGVQARCPSSVSGWI
ncbi:Zinc finger protein MAGPIE [Platanthera zijinensis]|uniref:Protein EARLY HEADING DATE 2 n=1 Tax=Platanthera zijinensis TaxID=2320716 RepID=A0AAP0AW57_9ASPA